MASKNVVEDVVALSSDSDSDSSPDMPLIHLFRRLIESENKQHTVQNSQIYEILQKEFNIDMKSLHVLEIDVYLAVVKKFLKEWPEWDSFDKIVSEGRKKGRVKIDADVLERNYVSAKTFLKNTLDIAQAQAKVAVNKMKEKEEETKEDEIKSDDPVLEVSATKAQLKHLFFRYPNSKTSRSIFNTDSNLPCQIKVNNMPLRSILNMWGVTVTITGPSDTVLYKHETNHEFKYVLVNKRVIRAKKQLELKQEIEYKGSSNSVINIRNIISFINNAYNPYAVREVMDIVQFIITSLRLLPQKVYQDSTYRRHTNKYPYRRYFCKDIDNVCMEDVRKYDLQLEETIIPLHEIYLGNFTSVMNGKTNMSENSITVTCTDCSAVFQGDDIVSACKMHFNMQHQNESDVECSNCKETFPVDSIANNWWCHKCKET